MGEVIVGGCLHVEPRELSSYLVTTPEGHVRIDAGIEQNADTMRSSIRALGFRPEDVRILLTTQAHFDHVGAHAAVRALPPITSAASPCSSRCRATCASQRTCR